TGAVVRIVLTGGGEFQGAAPSGCAPTTAGSKTSLDCTMAPAAGGSVTKTVKVTASDPSTVTVTSSLVTPPAQYNRSTVNPVGRRRAHRHLRRAAPHAGRHVHVHRGQRRRRHVRIGPAHPDRPDPHGRPAGERRHHDVQPPRRR